MYILVIFIHDSGDSTFTNAGWRISCTKPNRSEPARGCDVLRKDAQSVANPTAESVCWTISLRHFCKRNLFCKWRVENGEIRRSQAKSGSRGHLKTSFFGYWTRSRSGMIFWQKRSHSEVHATPLFQIRSLQHPHQVSAARVLFLVFHWQSLAHIKWDSWLNMT